MAGMRAIAAVLAVTALLAQAPLAVRAGEGWWGDLDKGQSVRLTDVMASPEAYRGRVLTFTCVFHRREREFNPLRTRFNSERYDNVSVWPDGQALWVERDYEQDFPFLYVPRAHAQHADLLRQETFTRLEVTGRIEVVLDGNAFIELTSFKRTGHRLGRDVVERMTRAETYARSGDAEARTIAIDNIQAALDDAPDLAPLYAVRLRTRLAELLRAAGRVREADAVAVGETSAAPDAAAAPATPYDPTPAPPAVELPPEPPGNEPFRPSLPGVPADTPAAPVEPRLPPAEPPGQGARLLPPPRAGDPFPPPPPPPEPAPGEPFRPSLPGMPTDTPAPPVKPVPGPAAPPPGTALPSPAAAPEVVDPPLPPPPKNGAPPARKPRLAGVK